jgi:hypothetical protein
MFSLIEQENRTGSYTAQAVRSGQGRGLGHYVARTRTCTPHIALNSSEGIVQCKLTQWRDSGLWGTRLRHNADLRTVPAKVQRSHIMPIERNPTAGWEVETLRTTPQVYQHHAPTVSS